MFLPTVQAEISQGDVLEGIEIVEPFTDPPSTSFALLLLSNDCDVDKPRNNPALMAARIVPMTTLEAINKGKAGDIRAGRVPQAMPLSGHPRIHDHFVDFRFIHRIPREAVALASDEGRRVASMTEEGRLAVIGWFHSYLARRQQPRKAGEKAPVTIPSVAPPPRPEWAESD